MRVVLRTIEHGAVLLPVREIHQEHRYELDAWRTAQMKHDPLSKRCEAWTVDSWFSETHRCPNRKAIQVNGKLLCGRHAALEALHLAMKNKTAKPLPRTPMRFEGVFTEPPPGMKVVEEKKRRYA